MFDTARGGNAFFFFFLFPLLSRIDFKPNPTTPFIVVLSDKFTDAQDRPKEVEAASTAATVTSSSGVSQWLMLLGGSGFVSISPLSIQPSTTHQQQEASKKQPPPPPQQQGASSAPGGCIGVSGSGSGNGMGPAVSVSCGGWHTCVVTEGGEVRRKRGWGNVNVYVFLPPSVGPPKTNSTRGVCTCGTV